MYEDFFGLRCKPFGNTPDPNFFYFAPEHWQALVSLSKGIEDRCGLMLLLGEVGTGKTTICCHIHNHDGYLAAYLNYPYLTEVEFLKTVNKELEVPIGDGSRYSTAKELQNYLVDRQQKRKPVVLIVDEAHRLAIPILDEILIMSNLQASNAHLLQIILAGQPSLLDTLRHPRLISLNQRIGTRCELPRLDRANTIDYVSHRLTKAGCTNPSIFTVKALDTIWERSGGTPRLINQLGERALNEAYHDGKKRVGRREVRLAADDPLYQSLYGPMPKQRTMRTALAGAALALTAGVLFGLWYFGFGSKYFSQVAGPKAQLSIENRTLIKKPIVLPEFARNLAAEELDVIAVEPDETVPVALYTEETKLTPDYDAPELTGIREPLATQDALPGIKLNAIAWDEDPERSIAVLNDRIVHEGDFLGEVRVLRIKPNHVVLIQDDVHLIKQIHKEERDQIPEIGAMETSAYEEDLSEPQTGQDSSLINYRPIINFDYRTAKITPEAYEKLDRMATIAKLTPAYEIVIRGYTDNVGSYRFNKELSRLRAGIVKGYLVKKGISPERIETVGMGESGPLVPNDTPEGRAANRRVEVELVRAGGSQG
jgi:type II secretory pathway predicted ATPase ExeA/outer membrane protein OmpA-like peptidoglycan-associated protein